VSNIHIRWDNVYLLMHLLSDMLAFSFRLAVIAKCTIVTDGQTEKQTDHITEIFMSSFMHLAIYDKRKNT